MPMPKPDGMRGRVVPDAALNDFALAVVVAHLGSATRVARVDVLQGGMDKAVLEVRLTGPPYALILKLAGPDAGTGEDFERTAAVSRVAHRAGAPVAAVLAADTSFRDGPWAYLLQEHVSGRQWREVRPLLDSEQVKAAHREIAAAVLAVQSVHFGSFGELDRSCKPAGTDAPDALRERARLRIARPGAYDLFLAVLEREVDLFEQEHAATLCHDDLHHANVVFRSDGGAWHLAALLDWDKAWAAPPESDIARMAFWDDMTGPGFWEVYRAAVPASPGAETRALIYQLLWCLEYDVESARHAADTSDLCRRLGVKSP